MLRLANHITSPSIVQDVSGGFKDRIMFINLHCTDNISHIFLQSGPVFSRAITYKHLIVRLRLNAAEDRWGGDICLLTSLPFTLVASPVWP